MSTNDNAGISAHVRIGGTSATRQVIDEQQGIILTQQRVIAGLHDLLGVERRSMREQLAAAEDRASELRQRLDSAELSADLAWTEGGQGEALAAQERETDRIRARRNELAARADRAVQVLDAVRETVAEVATGMEEYAAQADPETSDGHRHRHVMSALQMPLLHLHSRVAALLGGTPSMAECDAAGEVEDARADAESAQVQCDGAGGSTSGGGVSGNTSCIDCQPEEDRRPSEEDLAVIERALAAVREVGKRLYKPAPMRVGPGRVH